MALGSQACNSSMTGLSSSGSNKRTFAWLWCRFAEYLDELKEDINQESVKKSLASAKQRDPKDSKDRKQQASALASSPAKQDSSIKAGAHTSQPKAGPKSPPEAKEKERKAKARGAKSRGAQRTTQQAKPQGAKLHVSFIPKVHALEVTHAHFPMMRVQCQRLKQRLQNLKAKPRLHLLSPSVQQSHLLLFHLHPLRSPLSCPQPCACALRR